MAVSATPKNKEKITIGRISLLLIASKIDCGTRCETKSLRLKAAVSTPLVAVTGGIGRLGPAPGGGVLTSKTPSVGPNMLARGDHPTAREAPRAGAAASALCADPPAGVED